MSTPDDTTNVLVVDDLPEKLLVYRSILDEPGQHLFTASSGEEALRQVLARDFAVILLDVNMPGMNGLETASLIRGRKRSAHTPIIFVTAFGDELHAAEGYAQGAVDYITTPVVPGILRAKVRVFVDLHRMTQQVRRQAEERIALAAERSRREAAEDANRRFAFLARAGAVLGGSLDPAVTATEIVRLGIEFPSDAAVLFLPGGAGHPESILRGTAQEGGATVAPVERTALDPKLLDAFARVTDFSPVVEAGEFLGLSLRSRGQALAVLVLSRRGDGFVADDLTMARSFASRSAMALENSRFYRDLQLADRQKNEFLSMLAHELRNPLAPIRNANEVLRLKGHDPAKVRWVHEVIDRQLTHLVRLVDDLLDVSRLTLGKIRLLRESVDLVAVLGQAIEAVRPLVDQLGHDLKIDGVDRPIWVHGDRARLVQVFANLLNNAAKYTEPGGRIRLAVEVDSAGRSIEVRVCDSGVGIRSDLLSVVFELFTQENRSLDRAQGGLGIGLTLVRRLVEMHGGTVEAKSPGPGLGSEFIVRLPPNVLSRDEGGAVAVPSTGQLPSLRVAIVDDNADGVASLAEVLEILGQRVKVASDGPYALTLAREFDPDLILLDIGLPGMDGYEVARRLRGDVGSRAILVAVSGYGRDEDREASHAAGFADHFIKPVNVESLRNLIAKIGSRSVGE